MKRWLRSGGEDVLLSYLHDLDTPIALSVAIQLRHGCFHDLALRRVDPHCYPEGLFSALRFAKDLQAVDLLRKCDLPGSRKPRKEAALKAWEDAETLCFKTNDAIAALRGRESYDFPTSPFGAFLRQVEKRITRWLGPLPDELEGGFGPGTSFEFKALVPTVLDKLYVAPATTNDCAMLFEWHYSRTLWGRERWKNRLGAPVCVRGNRLTFVPKDAKTDRPISIEPLGNLWLQLGIGRYLKRRLHAIGLPAYSPVTRELFPGFTWKEQDAQAKHREVLGLNHAFSTIDLTSASDTLSLELVRAVLPPDWFELLDCCRSKFTQLPSGQYRHLEKFSSMGNGFTFELESMIFCALMATAFDLTPGVDLFVFGDDIILPREHYDEAIPLLKLCGFIPNRTKSFKNPPFFESCGANYFQSWEVTPVRVKGPMEDPQTVIAFHNAISRQWASPRTLRKVRGLVAVRFRVTGPRSLGDQVFHTNKWPSQKRRTHCSQITWVRTLHSKPLEIPLERWSDELAVVGMLLVGTTVTRRGPAQAELGWASVS